MHIQTAGVDAVLSQLWAASKMNADFEFIEQLFDLGQERADLWLNRHFDQIEVESSTDIRSTFF